MAQISSHISIYGTLSIYIDHFHPNIEDWQLKDISIYGTVSIYIDHFHPNIEDWQLKDVYFSCQLIWFYKNSYGITKEALS
jgi:hypothetical protein